MVEHLGKLSVEEFEELRLIPVWVSILIAGADDNIDRSEVKKAIELVREKQESSSNFIVEYYKSVWEMFEVNLKGYIALLPATREQRIEFLVEKLEKANYFLSKLDMETAHELYLSFREFALKVARASGGIFGLLSISYAESKYIDLKMITDPSVTRY